MVSNGEIQISPTKLNSSGRQMADAIRRLAVRSRAEILTALSFLPGALRDIIGSYYWCIPRELLEVWISETLPQPLRMPTYDPIHTVIAAMATPPLDAVDVGVALMEPPRLAWCLCWEGSFGYLPWKTALVLMAGGAAHVYGYLGGHEEESEQVHRISYRPIDPKKVGPVKWLLGLH
jgi:hypothetical protein